MKELNIIRKHLGSWRAVADWFGVSERTVYRWRLNKGKRGIPLAIRELAKRKAFEIQNR
jgi:hypothetical protein